MATQTEDLPDAAQDSAAQEAGSRFTAQKGIPSIDFQEERTWRELFSDTLFSFPTRIQARTSNATLMDLAKQRGPAVDPTVFEDHPPFMASVEASSNRVDSYFTRMQPSSLKNYAQDYADGVSVLASHEERSVFGRSLTGAYAGPQGNGVARATADFYTIPGLRLGGADSDQMILGIRSGILQDVSNGFYGGDVLCSICNRDIWSWDCPHMPGVRYGSDGKRDSSGDVAIGNVEGAHSAEFSLVYDGSTPGAGLLKAQQLSATGRMREMERSWVEMRYRVHLPIQHRQFGGIERRQQPGETQEDQSMADDQTRGTGKPDAPHDATITQIRAAVKDVLPADHAGHTDPLEAVRWLVAERARLSPLADDGRAYRTDLITGAMEEGVRAFGADFQQETYKDVLERSSLVVIKRMREDWASVAAKTFPGGRQTTEGDPPPAPVRRTDETPAAAFRG